MIDGDDEEGSGVASGVRWRVVLLQDGNCVGSGPCRLRDLYHNATSPCSEPDDGVGVDSVYEGPEAFPHSSYERRAGTNFGALAGRREVWKRADDDSVCQGSGGSSGN